jgi:hypothetical protein
MSNKKLKLYNWGANPNSIVTSDYEVYEVNGRYRAEAYHNGNTYYVFVKGN